MVVSFELQVLMRTLPTLSWAMTLPLYSWALILCPPRPVPYGDGGGRVRKFRQEDFQDEEDDDKKKSTYNGNSTQQQWTICTEWSNFAIMTYCLVCMLQYSALSDTDCYFSFIVMLHFLTVGPHVYEAMSPDLSSWVGSGHDMKLPSLMPSPCAPLGMKQPGE